MEAMARERPTYYATDATALLFCTAYVSYISLYWYCASAVNGVTCDMETESPLLRMSAETPTDYWNDSCIEGELAYAIAHGAVGATTNPVIVFNAIKKELPQWEEAIREIAARNPASEDDAAWEVIAHVAQTRAALLWPIFERYAGKKGRLSIQTNPKYSNDSEALVTQAIHFNTLFKNNNVKIPATRAGIAAIEEVTARGISINATVSYTVAQAIAVAEAIERGAARYAQEGNDPADIASVCTLMGGRLDEWLKHVAEREQMAVDPEMLEWSGVAVIKKAYRIYQERGYRTRILSAAIRNHYHWSELVGMDGVVTIPCNWARRFNNSSISPEVRIDNPVSPFHIDALREHFADFRKAYDEDGLAADEFAGYGPCSLIIRQFLEGYSQLVALLRDYTVPLPTE